MSEPTFIVPTPRERALAVAKAVSPLLVGALAFLGFSQLPKPDACAGDCAWLPLLRYFLAAGIVLLGTFAVLAVRRARLSWVSGQYPPPGTWVLFRTRVYTGLWPRIDAVFSLALCAVALFALVHFVLFLVPSAELAWLVLGLEDCLK